MAARGSNEYTWDPTTWAAWTHQGHRLWAFMPEGFWVYMYKVLRCQQLGSHDWTTCPYAHRGERARRRDPRGFNYHGVSCPDFRASQQQQLLGGGGVATCVRGVHCRYSHGPFELWCHPTRFRTRMCTGGERCPRPICFFAHHPAQRRNENDPVPYVRLPPPPPPRFLMRAPPPYAASVPRQIDRIAQAMTSKLRLYRRSPDAPSSSAAQAGHIAALSYTWPAQKTLALPPVPTTLASSPNSSGNGGRCADDDEECVLLDDFPYLDLIGDLVLD